MNTTAEQFGRERLGEVGICSAVVAFFLVGIGNLGREQDDGDMAGADVFLELAGKFDTVHAWHHDITYDNIGNMLEGQRHTFLAVLCLKDLIVVAERVDNVLTDVGIILDDEECRLLILGGLFGCVFDKSGFFHTGNGCIGFIFLVERVGIGVFGRNGEHETTPLPFAALDTDGSFVQIDKSTHQGKTYTRARSLMTSFSLVVPLEDMRQGIRGNTMAGIGHCDV